MMQQVAKGLLEEARGRAGEGRPSVPRGSLANSPLAACSTLLHFRWLAACCGRSALRLSMLYTFCGSAARFLPSWHLVTPIFTRGFSNQHGRYRGKSGYRWAATCLESSVPAVSSQLEATLASERGALRREEALTAEVGGAIALAAAAAQAQAGKAGGKKAAAAASTAAFEANLDLVVALGWAHVDAISLDCFVEELATAPASSAAALQARYAHCCNCDRPLYRKAPPLPPGRPGSRPACYAALVPCLGGPPPQILRICPYVGASPGRGLNYTLCRRPLDPHGMTFLC